MLCNFRLLTVGAGDMRLKWLLPNALYYELRELDIPTYRKKRGATLR